MNFSISLTKLFINNFLGNISVLAILLSSTACNSVIDSSQKNSIEGSGFSLMFNEQNNNFHFFSKINGIADHQIFYKTHFEINLPKGLINWKISGDEFFFEYENRQIIYLYVPSKNQGIESDKWTLKDVDYKDALNLDEYWNERNYNENFLYKIRSEKISKLYTNGKYYILLFNIKPENFSNFLKSANSFKLSL